MPRFDARAHTFKKCGDSRRCRDCSFVERHTKCENGQAVLCCIKFVSEIYVSCHKPTTNKSGLPCRCPEPPSSGACLKRAKTGASGTRSCPPDRRRQVVGSSKTCHGNQCAAYHPTGSLIRDSIHPLVAVHAVLFGESAKRVPIRRQGKHIRRQRRRCPAGQACPTVLVRCCAFCENYL